MRNIKDYYCKVDQTQANEAIELLIEAGEPISEENFKVVHGSIYLQCYIRYWYVGIKGGLESKTEVTFDEWKAILEECKTTRIIFSSIAELKENEIEIEALKAEIKALKEKYEPETIYEIGVLHAFADDEEDFENNRFVVGYLERVDNKRNTYFKSNSIFWYKYARKIKTIELC